MEDKTCNTCKFYEPMDERCAFQNSYYHKNEVCEHWKTYQRKTDADRNPFQHIPGQMSIEDSVN